LKSKPLSRPTVLASAIGSLLCGLATGAAAQTASPETGRLADVNVTAQKIAQPSSKTPISLTAVTGEDLRTAGATTAVGLTNLIPNVQIAPGTSGSTDISIRGIGSTNTTEVGDPATAFNIDGVYLGRPQSAGATFYDLERVEVLRGPQGTLYGRNATAGAVNLITNKPGKTFAGEANLGIGNYGLYSFEGLLNVPVSDKFAVRAVMSSSSRNGYLNTTSAANGFDKNRDDADNLSARIHGLVTFNADTKLLLTVDTSRNKGAGPGTVPINTFLNKSGAEQRTSLTNANEGRRDDSSNGFSAEFTAQTAVGAFTYLGAYRTFDRNNLSSTNATTSLTDSKFSQTSHELRLASSGKSDLTWVAGLYLFNEKGNIDATFTNPALANQFGPGNPGVRFIQDPVKSKSTAVFGQATYSVTSELRLTAGLRTTSDEKSRDGRTTNLAATFNSPALVNKAKVDYNQTTWKLGADYDLAKNVLVYANAATGYKAGGYFDGSNAAGDNTYRPELLTALEAGIKGRFLDNRLRLNAAVFSYDYKDLQISYVAVNPLSNTIGTITTNAAKAKNRGLELEAKLAVSDSGTVNVALGLLNAKYGSFVFPAIAGRPVAINLEGEKLDKAPSATLTLGYTHDWTLDSGAAVTAYIGSRYSSSYKLSNFAVLTPIQYTQPSFTRTDVSVTYTAPGEKWYAQGYARNLENRNVATGFAFSSLTGSNFSLADPRTFGIRAGVKF
jgi:iron complex outermembrane recepter protein